MGAPEVVAAFLGATRITTICHENPDSYTLGAATALRLVAERLGKAAEVVSGDPVPPFLSFMPRVAEVRSAPASRSSSRARRFSRRRVSSSPPANACS